MGIVEVWDDFEPLRDTVEGFSATFWNIHGRAPVIAVDSYHWIFHVQSGKYKTTTLQSFCIQWILRLSVFIKCGYSLVMVFDGPERPKYKRGEYKEEYGESEEVKCAKDICLMLGIPVVNARGEAEAECCMLQSEGKVDYVFSSDGDCMLFGATRVIYYEASSKAPGYTPGTNSGSERMLRIVHRDPAVHPRHKFLLQVLLIGGDYDAQSGIRGIGVKTAKQVASPHTGFSSRLAEIYSTEWKEKPLRNVTHLSPLDPSFQYDGSKQEQLAQLSRDIQHQLKTNEHHFFERRRPSAILPDHFPNLAMMHQYCFPLVENESFTPPNQCFRPNFAQVIYYLLDFEQEEEEGTVKDLGRLQNTILITSFIGNVINRTDKFEWYGGIKAKNRNNPKHYEELLVSLNKDYCSDIIGSKDVYDILSGDDRKLVREYAIMGHLLRTSKHFERVFSASKNRDTALRIEKSRSKAKAVKTATLSSMAKKNHRLDEFFKVAPYTKSHGKWDGNNIEILTREGFARDRPIKILDSDSDG